MTSEKLEALWQAIHERRLTNTAGHSFVPTEWLPGLLTEEWIRDLLDESSIDKDERPEIVRVVRRGGLKLFAVLVTMKKPDLIYSFCQQVNLESLNGGLLMDQAWLADVLGWTRAKEKCQSFLRGRDPDGMDAHAQAEWERLKGREAECARLCDEFLSTRDMFLSPSFPPGPFHRVIKDSVRLPFLQQDDDGTSAGPEPPVRGGHFGKIFKETLPPERYSPDENKRGVTIVRKELKSKGEGAYAQELRCMRLLRAARHPNILELFGSYTYGLTHNFLFREAVDGDLDDLLEKPVRPPQLERDEAFYLALCGLASALEQLHFYANDELGLDMIGCHHDLKPRNVLVDGGAFILADFGLSTMTERDDGPDLQILAQDRDLYFAAPENVDYATWNTQKVGLPSDIWSLGCIIVDVLTYMRGGPDAVRRFRDARQIDVDAADGAITVTLRAFHDGGRKLNPGVVRHLNDMVAAAVKAKKAALAAAAVAAAEPTAAPTLASAPAPVQTGEGTHDAKVMSNQMPVIVPQVELVQLARDMLTIDPSARPDIREVLQRLRAITLQQMAEPVCEALQASLHSQKLGFLIERRVFFKWVGTLEEAARKRRLVFPTVEAFSQTHETLGALLDEVRSLAVSGEDSLLLFSQLRRLNEQLLLCLDSTSRHSLRRMVELRAMPECTSVGPKMEMLTEPRAQACWCQSGKPPAVRGAGCRTQARRSRQQ